MAALQEEVAQAPANGPARRRMTEAEYVAWCDEDTRAEWVDGEVVLASPASVRHVDLVGLLVTLMRLSAAAHGAGKVLGPELQVRLGAQRRRRVPDVLFVSQERQDIIRPNHVEGAPDLIVEIVSPESLARDWREKYLEYEAAGVREYWVVDPMAQIVEAYALGDDARYARIPETDGNLRSAVLAGFYVRIEWLWQEPLPNVLDLVKEMGVV